MRSYLTMTSVKTFANLPEEMWREIAGKHPAACLALNCASKSLNKATADQAKLVDAIARDHYPEQVEDILWAKRYRKEIQQEQKRAQKVLTVGLLPIVSEIKSSRHRRADGFAVDPGTYVVRGILHSALSPLIIPLRIHSRVTKMNQSRGSAKRVARGVERSEACAEQHRMNLCDAIAKDPRWYVK